MENILGTKSWRNFLEGLKRKVDIFIGTKIYLTPFLLCRKVMKLNQKKGVNVYSTRMTIGRVWMIPKSSYNRTRSFFQ